MDNFEKYITENAKLLDNVYLSSDDEKDFISNSTRTWVNRRGGCPFSNSTSLSHNQILFVDFGMAFTPELGYAHPALLLRKIGRFCLVLPITSNSRTFRNAYHPTNNPGGDKNYYQVSSGTASLTCDCSVIVNQPKIISEARIIKFISLTGLTNDNYDEINNRCFELYFNNHYHYLETTLKNNSLLKMQLLLEKAKNQNFTNVLDVNNFFSGCQFTYSCNQTENKDEIEITLTDSYSQSETILLII